VVFISRWLDGLLPPVLNEEQGQVMEGSDMNPLLGDLQDQVAKRRVVAIIGAGVSIGATEHAPTASWIGLLKDGIARCESVGNSPPPAGWGNRQRAALGADDPVDRIGVATQIEERLGAPDGGEYAKWLRETVGQLRARDEAVLTALKNLGVQLVTTNYDGLLEAATGYPPVTWREGAAVQRVLRGEEVGILHLHGHWQRPDSVVLGKRSYGDVVGDEHAKTVRTALSLMRSFLFIGYGQGLSDPNFRPLLQWMRKVFASAEYRHFRLCLESEQAAIQAEHQQEERVFALSYGAKHADLAPFLESLVINKPFDKPAVPKPRSDRQTPIEPQRPDVGAAPELPTEELCERFIGRRGLLEDLGDALGGLEDRRRGKRPRGAAKVQAIWYHGFGGMGKSWFLRRAILEAEEQLPSVKVALVDWDQPTWRVPLSQPPETPRELLEPIARRLAQLYGAEFLDPYWSVERRTRDAEAEASSLRERFQKHLREFQEGKETNNAFGQALIQRNLWIDGAPRVEALKLVKQDRALHNDVFVRWFENGGAAASDPEAVLRPDALRVDALQGCMRALATQKAPLFLVMDTCEVIGTDLEQWMRQLIAPLCDGKTPFLALIGSRLPPDAAEPAGSRHLWRAAMEEERWRSVPFNEGVRFTVQEIAAGLQRVKPTLDDPEHLAERLHRITLGVPLALRSLIDLHEEGSEILTKLDGLEPSQEDEVAYQDAETSVVERVADRFLLHLSDREERKSDFRDIIALSLLHEINHELLKRLWQTDNVTSRLRELAKRYSLLAVGDLHATVRSFLRRRWRTEDRPPLVDEVIAQLRAATQEIELPGLPGEDPYMKVLAVRLNAAGWQEEAVALERFAPAIALSLAFDEHIHLMVDLAAEVRATDARSRVARSLRKLADQFRSIFVPPWGSDEILAWLEEEERLGTWSPAEKSALDLLKGLKRVTSGADKDALASLLSALDAFGDRELPPPAVTYSARPVSKSVIDCRRTANGEPMRSRPFVARYA
jgi:SIR2-like domain